MIPRLSILFLIVIGVLFLLMGGLLTRSRLVVRQTEPVMERKVQMVGRLELTDLCLFTEASYTRHLSMADFGTAFQDSPSSFEHFPTGGLVGPPIHIAPGATGSSLKIIRGNNRWP